MRLFSTATAQPRPELLLLISLAISPLPLLGRCLAPPSFDGHTSAARRFGQQQQQQFQQQEPVFETDGQRAGDYEQGSEGVDDDDDDDGWGDWLKEKYVVRDPFDDEFDQMVEETLEHWHVPGLSVAVVHGDYTFAKGYGKAILPDVPATPETLYYVGSTTKSFTAAAILLLIEDAQLQANNSASPHTLPPDLSLTTPVSSLIRDDFVLPDTYATSKATLEDLLTHRTGMPRHDLSLPGATGPRTITLRDHVANLRHLPLTADLRSAWQYCNMMYLALAHVLEQLTSTTWSEFVRARLWAPLSMPHTYASLTEARAQAPHLLSAPYYWHNATASFVREPYLPDAAALTGAGNVLSCVADYASYLRALLKRRPNPFASQDPFRQLRRAARAVVADPADSDDEEERGGGAHPPWTGPTLYGLGWMAQTYRVGGLRVYTHDGAVTGYAASMAYAPEAGWGVAVMANTEVRGNWAAERVVVRLVEGLVGTPVGERWDALAAFDGQWEKGRKKRARAREELYPGAPGGRGEEGWMPLGLPLERYAGVYVNWGYGNFTFVVEEGHGASPFEVDGVADDATAHRRRHLHASVKDKLWAFKLCLEHVSGEYFMAWQGAVEEMPNGLFDDEMPFKARFEVGVSGKVERLHLAMEPKMGEDMIVFTRVDE
ncbi:Penicillin-binding protein [Lasiodiplodia theobromae]|uniref:Penicillin-binding protein n=1 Tax=Lasiodiplodia theobromae TaxID=45133 RepID=UPI0015C3B615|nr:Penicillin-binding protein [Lasiodiplodia theobromae]KAF4545379.1 Penicillin-binding protein [Lasiodiplodia theobromae]